MNALRYFNSYSYVLKLVIVLLGINASGPTYANNYYLERFSNYINWSENLPDTPTEPFFNFIDSHTPLAKRLRERWLYRQAQQKNWLPYSQHYQPSSDINLQCFAQIANYHTGNEKNAAAAAIEIWQNGSSLPKSCDQLFQLVHPYLFTDNLISKRIALALEKRNIGLVRYLLKQYPIPKLQDYQLIQQIMLEPKKISDLTPSELHSEFYLYGLKRLIPINLKIAISVWHTPQTDKLLSEAQRQSFISQVTLYKAMRSDEDATEWFSKIKPQYYSDILIDWQIRLALKQQQWSRVLSLISQSKNNESLAWKYWQARALDEMGHHTKAQEIFSHLQPLRHYYGFLAALQLKKSFTMQDESIRAKPNLLIPFRPLMSSIQTLIANHELIKASRLISDFASELPESEAIAWINWVINDLHWYSKALQLSSTPLLTNQLNLRFPLVYKQFISQNSEQHGLPAALVYAIIRQESGFHETIISPAGARGLMQVMPATAVLTAHKNRLAYTSKDYLFNPALNIALGTAYLQHLHHQFKQQPILMIAGYNAGPRQVNYWIKNHPKQSLDSWIETLPWHETRNYLKNILSFYAVYQYRMGIQPNFDYFQTLPSNDFFLIRNDKKA